jgi:hypothetical protein
MLDGQVMVEHEKKRFLFDEDKKQFFKLEYPVHDTMRTYKQSSAKGGRSKDTVEALSRRFGLNQFGMESSCSVFSLNFH